MISHVNSCKPVLADQPDEDQRGEGQHTELRLQQELDAPIEEPIQACFQGSLILEAF